MVPEDPKTTLEIVIPVDIESIPTFTNNLKIGAIVLSRDCDWPVRTQVEVVVKGPQNCDPAILATEVVYVADGKVGLQILKMEPLEEARLQRILKLVSEMPSPPPAPDPIPEQTVSPTEGGESSQMENQEAKSSPTPQSSYRMSSTATPSSPPTETTSPPPKKLSVPPKGTLSFNLPTAIQQIHNKAENASWDKRMEIISDSVLGLLLQLAQAQFLGKLAIEEDEKTKTDIYFSKGQIVGVKRRPTDETETTAYLLRKEGKISETDYRDAREKRESTGQTDEKLLQNRTGTRNIAMVARKVMYQSLGRCLGSQELKYELSSGGGSLNDVLPIPINLRRVFFRGMVEAAGSYLTDELWTGLGPLMNLYVVLRPQPPFDPGQLRLSSGEQRFMDVTLAEPTRLRNLFAVSALSRVQSLRTLYALYILGFVDFLTRYRPADENVLPHLRQTLEEMRTMNHFDILQAHWTLLGPEIEKSYQRAKVEWEEYDIPSEQKKEATPLVQEILKRMKESFQFLKEDGQRRSHRNEVAEPTQRKFSSDLLFQHARTYLFRGDKAEARYHIEQALDLDPGNAEYRQVFRDCGGKN